MVSAATCHSLSVDTANKVSTAALPRPQAAAGLPPITQILASYLVYECLFVGWEVWSSRQQDPVRWGRLDP